jgi:hypothetical protein
MAQSYAKFAHWLLCKFSRKFACKWWARLINSAQIDLRLDSAEAALTTNLRKIPNRIFRNLYLLVFRFSTSI